MRQLPLGRIGDDPQRREGDAAIGRDSGRDMRFHVDRMGAGAQMQGALAGAVGDRQIHPGEIDDGRAERRRQTPAPTRDRR